MKSGVDLQTVDQEIGRLEALIDIYKQSGHSADGDLLTKAQKKLNFFRKTRSQMKSESSS